MCPICITSMLVSSLIGFLSIFGVSITWLKFKKEINTFFGCKCDKCKKISK